MPILETSSLVGFDPHNLSELTAREHLVGHTLPTPKFAHRFGMPYTDIERMLRSLVLEDALRQTPLYDEYLEEATLLTLETIPSGWNLIELANKVGRDKEKEWLLPQPIEHFIDQSGANGVYAHIFNRDSGISVSASIPKLPEYGAGTVAIETIGGSYQTTTQRQYPITALSIVRTCIRKNENQLGNPS